MAGISIRSCLQSLLKVVNSFIGFIGIAMILYGLWMIRVWQRGIDGSSFHSAPWFIYTFIGIGVTLCVITCLGHTAADSANSLCLSSYMVIIVLLLLTETAVTADMLLNSDWEKDLPEDPTGWFHVFKDFVESNFDMSKWIGFIIVSAQGFSILLAMILRALGPDQSSCHDNDQDHVPMMLPLLNHPVQPSHTVGKVKNNPETRFLPMMDEFLERLKSDLRNFETTMALFLVFFFIICLIYILLVSIH